MDCSDPRHDEAASARRKHWSSSNRTYVGRSTRNRKRRVKDQGARRSIPRKAGEDDRSLSGEKVMQPLASGSHFSAASIIFSSCRSPKQLPPKPTKAILAANVCGPVEGQRGETSKRASSLRRASSILCIFPGSANHSLHGTMLGEAEFYEREGNRPRSSHRMFVRR